MLMLLELCTYILSILHVYYIKRHMVKPMRKHMKLKSYSLFHVFILKSTSYIVKYYMFCSYMSSQLATFYEAHSYVADQLQILAIIRNSRYMHKSMVSCKIYICRQLQLHISLYIFDFYYNICMQLEKTPLYYAAENNDVPVVETLVRLGAEFLAIDEVGY